jgi:hypothetical protein
MTGYGLAESYVESYWLLALERAIGPKMHFKAAASKCALDLAIFVPLNLFAFFTWVHVLEPKKESFWSKLSRDYVPTYALSCAYWGPYTLLIFSKLPSKWRMVSISLSCVAWDAFLSYAGHNSIKQSLN